ncbi:hypothetical protein VUR80DRAFT_6652 [Thermomyces stellatus]
MKRAICRVARCGLGLRVPCGRGLMGTGGWPPQPLGRPARSRRDVGAAGHRRGDRVRRPCMAEGSIVALHARAHPAGGTPRRSSVAGYRSDSPSYFFPSVPALFLPKPQQILRRPFPSSSSIDGLEAHIWFARDERTTTLVRPVNFQRVPRGGPFSGPPSPE